MNVSATNLIPLQGIHFLIHPLFNAFSGTDERLVPESEHAAHGGWANGFMYVDRREIEFHLQLYPRLVPAYLERAAAIKGREVLLTFLPFERGALRFLDTGFEPHYERLMSGLHKLLFERSLVFYADVDPVKDAAASDHVWARLADKGWAIPGDLASYAFGETVEHCIPQAVRHLRRGLGLRKFTRVHPAFTELRFVWPTMSDAQQQAVRDALRVDQILVREWST